MEISTMYYSISIFLMVGCGFMSYFAGRREGVEKMLAFLEAHSDENNQVKVLITDHEFEFLNPDE